MPECQSLSRVAAHFAERAQPALRASIIGTGAALPERVVHNAYFVEALGLDTSEEWIESKTGIRQRRFADDAQSASDLAVEAGLATLESAQVPPGDVELIIVATCSPDYTMPSTACLVQRGLGADRAMAFDVVNACTGFVSAFDAATRYLQTGVETALVIGVDLASRLVDPRDRGTCVFFGDGAGAVLLSASGEGEMAATQLHARGDAAPLSAPVGGPLTMDGRAIWQFATDVLPATLRGLCASAGIGLDDLALIVPHQANLQLLRCAATKLRVPFERFAVNVDRCGNTMAASIPLALHEALSAGRAERGDWIALAGFGAGLAWGGTLLKL